MRLTLVLTLPYSVPLQIERFYPLMLPSCRLRDSGLPIRFITNTTKESKKSLLSRLSAIGFQISTDQIFTCLTAARGIIEREHLKPYLMLEHSAMEDFEGIVCDSSDPDAVVVGLAPSLFNYDHMNKAFRLV